MVKKNLQAEKKSTQAERSKVIEKFTQKLLDLLEVKANFKVEEQTDGFTINFETENPGILIGYHGETLSSFQLLLSMMVYRKFGEWVRILVDVGDYRTQRKAALERIALSAAQKVKFSNQEYELPPMNASERRIIHISLTENPDVETESKGEGRERRVVVKPKSK